MLTILIGILGPVFTKVILTLAFAITAWLIAKVIIAAVQFIKKIAKKAIVIYRMKKAQKLLDQFKRSLSDSMINDDEADVIRRGLDDLDKMVADDKCALGVPVNADGDRDFSTLNLIECTNDTPGDMEDEVIMINDAGRHISLQRN